MVDVVADAQGHDGLDLGVGNVVRQFKVHCRVGGGRIVARTRRRRRSSLMGVAVGEDLILSAAVTVPVTLN